MLLELKGLHKTFISKGQAPVRAVAGVALSVRAGESLGIVGESGCGKTTVAKIIMGLVQPDAGQILFEGKEVWGRPERERVFRRRVRMVFQDPQASLDPRFSIRDVLKEALCLEKKMGSAEVEKRMARSLKAVGLSAGMLGRYPDEFSGGERQRISIARALMTDPSLLILDEAVSALDVLIQKEILELIGRLQKERSITSIFISHNLGAVRKIADKIVVMYQGRIVEYGASADIFQDPRHAYTKKLLSAAVHYRVDAEGDVSFPEEGTWTEVGQGHWVRGC